MFSKQVEVQPEESEIRSIQSRFKKLKFCVFTAGGKGAEACLYYVAWSMAKNETISYLRKQCETLHTYIICAGTRRIMKHFKENPSYDLVNDDGLCFKVPALKEYCNFVWQDPSVMTNLYLPMRLHPMTRAAVNTIILRHKPKMQSS